MNFYNLLLQIILAYFRKWRFEDVNSLIVFHLIHCKGQFTSSHFNTEIMNGDGEIIISIPYITVIVVKSN